MRDVHSVLSPQISEKYFEGEMVVVRGYQDSRKWMSGVRINKWVHLGFRADAWFLVKSAVQCIDITASTPEVNLHPRDSNMMYTTRKVN